MPNFPVKFINNNMRGAPQISGAPGTWIAALDAFLLTGFGTVTALSVTVSGGIATATVNAGSSFDPYAVVLVAGATPDVLNGEQRVLTATNTGITWATTAPDGPATGTITIKVAPMGGWEKVFSATNKAAYRSTDVSGSRSYLYVDDTGTTAARVRSYEGMTDISTGIGPFPSDALISGGGYQPKSVSANSNPVRYDFFADGRTVYWAIAPGSANGASYMNAPLRGFGDMLPLRPGGDAYAVALSCRNSADPNNYLEDSVFGSSSNSSNAGIFMPRAISGLGGAVRVTGKGYASASNATSGRDSSLGAFPSSVDGELKYTKQFLGASYSPTDNTPRAEVPGVLVIPQSGVAATIGPRDMLDGTGLMAGRKLMALLVDTAATAAATNCGVYVVDITGPWR